MTTKDKRIIKGIISRYSKKLHYTVELWEIVNMYTDGNISITDEEEDALSEMIHS